MNKIIKDIWNFRDKKIPKTSVGLRNKIDDYIYIEIEENNQHKEDLVSLHDYGIKGIKHYHAEWNPPYYNSIPGSIPQLLARRTLAEKMANINKELKEIGLELFVFDAYRPIDVQNHFYFEEMPKLIRKLYPYLSKEEAREKVKEYWAPGSKTKEQLEKNIPPHLTGGAVDLTLSHIKSGQLLEMGTIFDDISERSHLDYFEKMEKEKLGFTETEAKKNRRLLYNIMDSADFSCNPKEWWHFSFGDQMWAFLKGKEKAFYGMAHIIEK